MFDPVIWVILLCSLYVAVGVSYVCTAGSAQYSSVYKFLNLIVKGILTFCVHPF
jgi:hypothetical protein